jgi:hypothetical protein
MEPQYYKQNQIKKVGISLKQLIDVDTTNALFNKRLDNIRDNQILISGTNKYRQDVFRFKYLTDLIVAGSGVTITSLDGILTISATGGGSGGVPTTRNIFTTAPLTGGGDLSADRTIAIPAATGSVNGYLTAIDWTTFNNKVPPTRTLTINGVTFDLSANRSWTVTGASPLTTKGDLYTFTSVNARLPVGTNGQILYADSTTPTGLKWDTAPTGGGGLSYGIASGTNNYTVTISGVTGYTAGDAYIISFTNGNDDDSDININSLGVKTLVKEFDVQLTGGDIVSGQDLIIIYDGTNFQTIGVAPNQLFTYVTNDDSVTITKGQPVYAFGAAGNRMSVKLAFNTSDTTSAQTVGVVFSTSIAPNQRGFVITQGVISGVNTAAYSPGDQLYLGATAGTLTATKPHAPNHLVYIGIVERANAGNGQIYVKPQNGFELDELHNVQAQSPANNDTLYYDLSATQWKTKSIPNLSGPSTIGTTIDGSGGTITVGQKGYVQIPYACTITGWRLIANAAGSIVVDIWKTAAPTIPTVANVITASAKPTLSSQQTATSSTLTGWTTSVAANDIIGFNVNSATTVSWVILQIFVTKI